MRRAARLGLAALVLVLVPASAGASTTATRPPLALTAVPARVALTGPGTAPITVVNPGSKAVVVEAVRAGFALDLRGRPRVVGRAGPRAAVAWLAVRPARFVLPAGGRRVVDVSVRLPARAEPGDHDALVLLTTRPKTAGGVSLRMRLGVVVVVRAPGRVVRRLVPTGLRVRRDRVGRVLELTLRNRGNVTESLPRGRVRLTLQKGRRSTTLSFEPRVLRPRSSGIAELAYRGRLEGWVTARVRVRPVDGAPAGVRTFRLRL